MVRMFTSFILGILIVPWPCSMRVHATPRQPSSHARAKPTGPPPTIRTGVLCMFGKRPGIARYLVVDVRFLPVPGQEFIDPVHGMAIGHALQDVLEIGEWLDIIELCS